MSKKHLTSCSDCRYQMGGFDGGFFGLPVTCECKHFGVTENRKNCRKFEKKITREYLFDKIYHLEKENDELKKKLENIREEVIGADFFSDEEINHDIIAYLDSKDCYNIACAIKKIKKE